MNNVKKRFVAVMHTTMTKKHKDITSVGRLSMMLQR